MMAQHSSRLGALEARASALLDSSKQRYPPLLQPPKGKAATRGAAALYRQPPPAAGLSPLHHEVARFARACAPTAGEVADVTRVMSQVDGVVRAIWPHARTLLFGSQVGGPAGAAVACGSGWCVVQGCVCVALVSV